MGQAGIGCTCGAGMHSTMAESTSLRPRPCLADTTRQEAGSMSNTCWDTEHPMGLSTILRSHARIWRPHRTAAG